MNKPNNGGFLSSGDLPKEIAHKVEVTLVAHVYNQIETALAASFFCAGIVVIGFYSSEKINTNLYIWAALYLFVVFLRVCLLKAYRKERIPAKRIRMWRRLYEVGACLGGVTWGLAALLLLPDASYTQQTLLILMLAGVTSGAAPLSAALPAASNAFLIAAVVPFMVILYFFKGSIYLLFDFALTLYLLYTIVVVARMHVLMKNSILLKFENDNLLLNLTDAKTQLEISNQKLEQAATHDPLTQLANRNLFQENLQIAMDSANKNKTLLALLYLDLDHFKEANDTYGHEAGDLILTTVTERIKDYFGSDKNIARLGGDEIAVILDNINNLNEIVIIARKLCQLVALPIPKDENQLKVTASIGVSIYPNDGSNAEALVRSADKNMYSIKNSGGNNVYFGKELAKL